jgi:tRNA modification GTPase
MVFESPIKKTIAAICTAQGVGAIAVIRISGPEAFTTANRIFSKKVLKIPTHLATYGQIVDSDRKSIDDVLLLPMKGPKTYTGEDTVEIFCHGGLVVPQKILQEVIKAGALPAGPGEFTLQAFLNEKLDLTQAEAIEAKIASQNALAMKASSNQLEGRLSDFILSLQKKLIAKSAILEAWVDFPEEDLAFAPFEEMIQDLITIQNSCTHLLQTFDHGKYLKNGIRICLAGPPNVGKSSLMNLLLGKERSIVASIAGTTRDVIEDTFIYQSIPFVITDTAGFRDQADFVEQEGINRAQKALQDADIVFALFDASFDLMQETIYAQLPLDKTLFICNKIDLHPLPTFKHPFIPISAKTGEGVDRLLGKVLEKTKIEELSSQDLIITSERHKKHLETASQYLDSVISGLKNKTSAEFVAYDLRSSLEELGMIIGMNINEEVLSSIFSTFCIGK